MPEQLSSKAATARPGFRPSFEHIATHAREVLREQGLSDKEIEAELNRPRRETPLR